MTLTISELSANSFSKGTQAWRSGRRNLKYSGAMSSHISWVGPHSATPHSASRMISSSCWVSTSWTLVRKSRRWVREMNRCWKGDSNWGEKGPGGDWGFQGHIVMYWPLRDTGVLLLLLHTGVGPPLVCAGWQEGGRRREVDLRWTPALDSRERQTQWQQLPYRDKHERLVILTNILKYNFSNILLSAVLFYQGVHQSQGLIDSCNYFLRHAITWTLVKISVHTQISGWLYGLIDKKISCNYFLRHAITCQDQRTYT